MIDISNEKKKKIRGQNEGTIRQRKDGTWEARYTIGVDANGKQIRKSIYGKTRPEVSKKLIKALNDLNAGVYIEPSKLTVASWLDTWLEEYKKTAIKPKTYDSYKQLIELYIKPAIGHIPLKDLRPDHVQTMLNEIKSRIPHKAQLEIKKFEKLLANGKDKSNQKKLNDQIESLKAKRISSRTVKYVNIVLHGALEQALKNDLVIRNITKSVTLPKKEEVNRRVLTIEEQKKLIEALEGERLGIALKVLLCTGLRVGELLALYWNDIDLKNELLKVNHTLSIIRDYNSNESNYKFVLGTPKTEKSKREIPLLDNVVDLLRTQKIAQAEEKLKAGELYNDINLVFCNEMGQPVHYKTISKVLYRAAKKAGISHVNLHALRHTFATRGLEKGIELKVMQELLGHSTITMTADIYSHVLPEKKREAIKKLEGVF